MPINLTGSRIADSYVQLLHIDGGLAAQEKPIYTGVGVPLPLEVGLTSASMFGLRFSALGITSKVANGNIAITPDGTGQLQLQKVVITSGSITNITDLAIEDGGTGASTAANARLNLGLGSIATQSASNVMITGGQLSNVTLVAVTFSGLLIDNIEIVGNTIRSVDMNGHLILDANGTGEIKAAAPFGYGGEMGVGGSVTQLTDRLTSVMLNKLSGQIVLFGPHSIANHASEGFVFNNSFIDPTDLLILNIASGATADVYDVQVVSIGMGTARIVITNHSNSATPADTLTLNFAVLKAVNA